MNIPSNEGKRVCFSFPHGTLDLLELAPQYVSPRTDVAGMTVALRMEARHWHKQLARLGPVVQHVRNPWSMGASSLPRAEYLPVPGTREWVESHSGLVTCDMIRWQIQAFIEVLGSQEVGGLVFIDEDACERFRIYLSQASDLEIFDELVTSYAGAGTLTSWKPYPALPVSTQIQLTPTPLDVMRAWEGLSKMPGNDGHHVWPDISRRTWLAAAGPTNARPQSSTSFFQLLNHSIEQNSALTLLPCLPDTYCPTTLEVQRVAQCSCGVHIFGRSAQMKLSHPGKMELWQALYPLENGRAQFVWHAFNEKGGLAWTLLPGDISDIPSITAWNDYCGHLWE